MRTYRVLHARMLLGATDSQCAGSVRPCALMCVVPLASGLDEPDSVMTASMPYVPLTGELFVACL